MQKWDRALVQACPSYPNMRIYDWAGVVQPSWFISDGIHYSTLGSAQRAHLIATALAEAFPQRASAATPVALFPDGSSGPGQCWPRRIPVSPLWTRIPSSIEAQLRLWIFSWAWRCCSPRSSPAGVIRRKRSRSRSPRSSTGEVQVVPPSWGS